MSFDLGTSVNIHRLTLHTGDMTLGRSLLGVVGDHVQGCPRPKFTTLPVQVQVPAVVVVPVQVDETKPAVVVVPVQVDETKPSVVVVPVQEDETKPAVVVVPVQVDETKPAVLSYQYK